MASTPEQPTPALSVFDDAYASRTAPWVIGEPQPAIVTLEREGWVQGKVLDVGCGTGEHTIYLSALGFDVYGLDSSPRAVEQARANAAARNVEVDFQVADALALGDDTTYDTVIDSALFHIFDADDRDRYVRSLHRACLPGALVYVLAVSDTGPGFGPQASDATIREPSANNGYWRTCALHSIEAQSSATSTLWHFTARSASSLTYPHG